MPKSRIAAVMKLALVMMTTLPGAALAHELHIALPPFQAELQTRGFRMRETLHAQAFVQCTLRGGTWYNPQEEVPGSLYGPFSTAITLKTYDRDTGIDQYEIAFPEGIAVDEPALNRKPLHCHLSVRFQGWIPENSVEIAPDLTMVYVPLCHQSTIRVETADLLNSRDPAPIREALARSRIEVGRQEASEAQVLHQPVCVREETWLRGRENSLVSTEIATVRIHQYIDPKVLKICPEEP